MVYHPFSITKSFSRGPFRLTRPLSGLLLGGLLSVFLSNPATALIKMDSQTVDAALVYGMRNQSLGLSSILGPNWVEGDNGALLNIYSPFMMISTKAAKAGLSSNPAKSDLEKARKRFRREVAYYSDTKNRFKVKFAISFYGDRPGFAESYEAKIVGFGRGKEFEIKPAKSSQDKIADSVSGGQSGSAYVAINSYYFNFADLENLDEFTLTLESPSGPPLKFNLKNDRLY